MTGDHRETESLPRDPRLSCATAVLTSAERTFRATSDHVVIGTHERCDLVLDEPSVSRFHCEIRLSKEGAFLRDLSSMNGTFIDGVRVDSAWLHEGATITVGRVGLRFGTNDDAMPISVSASDRFGQLVGRSTIMRRVFASLEQAAASDATVLLGGETGTGKELAAEGLHQGSTRRDAPFVVVDCGSLPRELVESELFGHEKGSFTGAVASRRGAFEAASGGTLFLDEIGELAADLQPKLLRVLERKEIKRIGSNEQQKVDVRVVAATNRDLRQRVNDKSFRSDLYYRLAVVEIGMPALRDHAEDIPLLVEHMLASMKATLHPAAAMLRDPSHLAELAVHHWPGNVRELRNYVERCIALSRKPAIDADRAPRVDGAMTLEDLRQEQLRLEGVWLRQLVERFGGNIAAAARAANVDRAQLYRLLWRHGIR